MSLLEKPTLEKRRKNAFCENSFFLFVFVSYCWLTVEQTSFEIFSSLKTSRLIKLNHCIKYRFSLTINYLLGFSSMLYLIQLTPSEGTYFVIHYCHCFEMILMLISNFDLIVTYDCNDAQKIIISEKVIFTPINPFKVNNCSENHILIRSSIRHFLTDYSICYFESFSK